MSLPYENATSVTRRARKAVTPQPITPEEWQAAVDAAKGALALDSARQYGLVTGGPKVNVDRCVEILDAGRERGIVPSPDAAEKFAAELAQRPVNPRKRSASAA